MHTDGLKFKLHLWLSVFICVPDFKISKADSNLPGLLRETNSCATIIT